MKKQLNKRYTFIGRVISGLQTYQETHWITGYKFTKKERIERAYANFKDMPSCTCNNGECTIHENTVEKTK